MATGIPSMLGYKRLHASALKAGVTSAQFVMMPPFPGTIDFGRWEKVQAKDHPSGSFRFPPDSSPAFTELQCSESCRDSPCHRTYSRLGSIRFENVCRF